MYVYIFALEVIIIMQMRISNPPGKTWPWKWPCNLQDTFCAITMTSWFGVTCVRCGLWLSGRVSALHSVVAGSISSGGDHSIHCWWDLIRSKQLSSVSVCCGQVITRFSGHGNSIHNIIPLLKKEKCIPNPRCRWFQIHHLVQWNIFPSLILRALITKFSYTRKTKRKLL